ncbi:MAG TPA: M14 family zinc carboxypeptidase [Bacteroidales bacterium]|nr:M14 family zinc carboxypeptidase [Bacteroidales bacterium]
MNRRNIFFVFVLFALAACTRSGDAPETTEALLDLKFSESETVTYYEAIEYYTRLADRYAEAELLSYGVTDAGKPLHLFVMSVGGVFDPAKVHESGRAVVLINNGIHPGEPEGIDASLWFADDVLRNANGMRSLLDSVVVCIVPVYNVGGSLNRSAYHRTGQTSPHAGGHRGNAKNLDLNRDFVKMDTKNAKAFAEIFHTWNPDVFLDTHTTNGSDHQYVITLIEFQPDALPAALGAFYRDTFIPHLYEAMEQTDYPLIPYVSYLTESPKGGIALDLQQPHFSTGYVGLFNTLGFMTENHIYKDFDDRVRSVYDFLGVLTGFTASHSSTIRELRAEAAETITNQKEFTVQWSLDTSQRQMIRFRGYEDETGISPVTGLPRRGYNRQKPYDTLIPFYDHYVSALTVEAPEFYIVPSAWEEVTERLALNRVKMCRLAKDTALVAEYYKIINVASWPQQYNWHRYHSKVQLEKVRDTLMFYAGDYVIKMNQPANKYIVEMLEPEAEDSFFRWNFFDPCLESREYFSSYGFEENAMKYLDTNPDFKKQFEEAVKNDPALAASHRAQMGYIYENTEWADNRVNRYPVVRLNEAIQLPLVAE